MQFRVSRDTPTIAGSRLPGDRHAVTPKVGAVNYHAIRYSEACAPPSGGRMA
ncbi:hypothetical protein [Merismopedia glauca]|uniref:hypothetical protein n=1 Tax=Merismopedia glauca TaxID=292586 RepID=UPI0015E62CB9|nr:hypothetical protein [Merismopedia glauca]